MADFPWGDAFAGVPRCPQAPSYPGTLGANERAHVGVVFVHGVGFQRSGETFRESIGPFMRLLREAAFSGEDPLLDPTRAAAQELPGTELPFVELDLPRSSGLSREHWVITEAWWAESFAPPSLATMIGWLGAQGKAAIAARRIKVHGRRTDDRFKRWPSYGRPTIYSIPLEITLTVLVSLLLVIYSTLRTLFTIIPVKQVRETLIGPIDRFVQEWAGDMRVLLIDETQAAMVRFRIASSIRALQAYGCQSVVVIGHSGGAVASYMTLADELYRDLPVRTLVTYGSGLNVAWRLLEIDDRTHPEVTKSVGGRLGAPLPDRIEWHDFWGTDDPIPAGPANEAPWPACVPLKGEGPPHTFGNRVNNRWSLTGDHGSYLSNDEEFLVPVATAIDEQVRPPEARSLFDHWAPDARSEAIALRRERVAALSMWSHFVTTCAVVSIFAGIVAGLFRFWTNSDGDGLTRPLGDVTDWMGKTLLQLLGQDVTAFLPPASSGSTPPASPADLSMLSLVGYLLWLVLLAALVMTLPPATVDWFRAWRGSPLKGLTVLIAAGLGWASVGFALLLGVPGLLGVMLASSPAWDWPPFAAFRQGLESATIDLLGRAWGSALMNLIVALVIFLAGVVILAVAALLIRWMRGRPRLAFATNLTLSVVGLALLVCLVVAVLASGGFRSNLAGWLLILVIFLVLGRVGQWRWKQWDEQERWEVRSSIAATGRRRRLGRQVDGVVFALLVVASGVTAAGIIVRVLSVPTGTTLLIVAGVAVLIAVLAGMAQDEVNMRLGRLGEGPSVASAVAKSR